MKFNLVAWNEIKGKVYFTEYMQIVLNQIWNNLSKPCFRNYQKALKNDSWRRYKKEKNRFS